MEITNILDYFDIYNADHLKAYQHLEKTGSWPEGFLPENIKFPPFWQINLSIKMALAWIKSIV
jgi:hypothetical protein